MSAIAQPLLSASYRRGAILITGATLFWSLAGLLARLAHTDPWTTLFWRSVFALAFLLAYLIWRDGRGVPAAFRRLGRAGFGISVCFALSMICFINALSLTTVAAVLIFQAAAPLFAAAFAWLLIRERVTPLKIAAIIVSMVGVAIMVHGVNSPGGLAGIALSTVMSLTFAGTIVLARVRPNVPTTEASTIAVALVALTSLPMAELHLSTPDLALMATFGIGQMGLALIMFTAGIRLLPAADAGLISILETVLAPLWVWLVFAETPDANTLIGGAVILAAVFSTVRSDPTPLP